MDKIQNAAIIILGMGDKCASEILKNMTPKEVQRIMEAINNIDTVSEEDVIRALNSFFKDSNKNAAIDYSSRENIKNSMATVLGMRGIEGADGGTAKWIERLKKEPVNNIVQLIQDEHPQIITAVIVILTKISSDKASKVVKSLPKELQSDVIKRMTKIGSISNYAIDTLSNFFEKQFENPEETYNVISVDGVEAAADIMSYLDSDIEREVISDLNNTNEDLANRIQEKMLPFEKLAYLDKKSLQTLMKEIPNEDLMMALKGVDDFIKNIFMKCMSTKSAEILRDEMEALGPVKLAGVTEAQKRIIIMAKKMAEEEKIILSTKQDPGIIF
jgi:flagellar motor switch protein FliG